MKKGNEKGITLVALVITIVILIIIASVSIDLGTSTIKSGQYTVFVNELKVMQYKVNELYNSNEQNSELGQALTNKQLQVLNNDIVSSIIFNGKTDEQKDDIKNGFRYFSQEYIRNELEIDNVNRDYLLNIDKRIVICNEPFNYNGINYYMLEQTDQAVYNVEYNNKNSSTGSFDVIVTQEEDKWKIEVSNIQYDGYVSNWQVKYKLNGKEYWDTSNDLTFYLREKGIYFIKVICGDEIDLGVKTVNIEEGTEEI